MNSRDTILGRLRQLRQADVPRPESEIGAIRYEDKLETFVAMATAVGSQVVVVSRHQLWSETKRLQGLLPTQDSRVASWVDGVAGNVSIELIEDVRDLDGLDVGWVGAELGVAENGAVWLTASDQLRRAALFLAEHLVVVLDADNVVHNMHDAYRAVAERGLLEGANFGTWISGPSKTADIEQSLVIGAQGPCAHTIVLVDSDVSA